MIVSVDQVPCKEPPVAETTMGASAPFGLKDISEEALLWESAQPSNCTTFPGLITMSKTDKDLPRFAVPTKEIEAPTRPKLRRDSDDPKCEKATTETEAPKRAKLRNESEEPKCMHPKTDNDAPNRAMPNTDSAEPKRVNVVRERGWKRMVGMSEDSPSRPATETYDAIRQKLRIASVLPTVRKSNKDMELPSLDTPRTDSVEPSLEQLLIAIEAPKLKKSSKDKEAPSLTIPMTESEAASREKPRTANDDPMC